MREGNPPLLPAWKPKKYSPIINHIVRPQPFDAFWTFTTSAVILGKDFYLPAPITFGVIAIPI